MKLWGVGGQSPVWICPDTQLASLQFVAEWHLFREDLSNKMSVLPVFLHRVPVIINLWLVPPHHNERDVGSDLVLTEFVLTRSCCQATWCLFREDMGWRKELKRWGNCRVTSSRTGFWDAGSIRRGEWLFSRLEWSGSRLWAVHLEGRLAQSERSMRGHRKWTLQRYLELVEASWMICWSVWSVWWQECQGGRWRWIDGCMDECMMKVQSRNWNLGMEDKRPKTEDTRHKTEDRTWTWKREVRSWKSELRRDGRWGKEERGREAGESEGIYTPGWRHRVPQNHFSCLDRPITRRIITRPRIPMFMTEPTHSAGVFATALRFAALRWATKLPGTARSPSHVHFLIPSMPQAFRPRSFHLLTE